MTAAAQPAHAMIREFVDTLRASSKPRAKGEGRTAHLMRRIEAHMADMSHAEKIKFLNVELEKWFERYKDFSTGVMRGDPLTSDATAWDYAATIGAISAKIGRLNREKPVPA